MEAMPGPASAATHGPKTSRKQRDERPKHEDDATASLSLRNLSKLILPPLGVSSYNQSQIEPRSRIIYPMDSSYRCWETFMVLLVAYSAWVCPFEVAFMNAAPKGGLCIADNIVDAFFAIDIVLTFFVAYIDSRTQLLVQDQRRIAIRVMETGASSSRKISRNRRLWDRREEDILIEALKEIVVEGWKADNGFKAGFLQILESKLTTALPGTDLRGTPHIESKIKTWKKHYNCLGDMLNTSGFGWNDTTKTVEVESDDVWETYVKRDPSVAFMRNKPFVFFDAWTIIFGKDRATGEHAESAADAVEAIRSEEDIGHTLDVSPPHVNDGIEDLEFSATPTQQAPSQHDSVRSERRPAKKKKGTEGLVDVLSKFVDRFGTHCEDTKARMEFIGQRVGHAQDVTAKRERINAELHKLPLTSDERLDATLAISNNNQYVEVFFSLSEEDKLNWVRRLARSG